jgi:prepilin-type N-terminal cleavage/methylation domain-containing protein
MTFFLTPGPCLLTPARRRRAVTLLEVIVVMAIIAILFGLMLVAIGHARLAADRSKCQNNLRQQGLAVLAFEAANGFLPPAAAHGAPLGLPDGVGHGLYAYILPQLDEGSRAAQYRWDLSFDAPGNAAATAGAIAVLQCPMADPPQDEEPGGAGADYGPLDVNATLIDYGLVSPGASPEGVLPMNARGRLADVADGTSTTLMLSESPGSNPWASPMTPIPTRMVVSGFQGPHGSGILVCFADGSVRPLKPGAKPAVLAALATRAGGEPVPADGY